MTSTSGNRFRSAATHRAALLVPAALTVLLALPSMTKSFWFDEAASAVSADRSLSATLQLLTHVDGSMSAYYVFLNGWTKLFGTSEFAIRFPSLLAMTGAVILTGMLGRRLGSAWIGLAAAILFAVAPRTVSYAAEARPYALAVFFTVLAAWLAARFTPTRPGWAFGGFTVAATFATGFQLMALLPLAFVALFLSGWVRRIVALVLPVVTAGSIWLLMSGQPNFQSWLQRPSITTIVESLFAAGAISLGLLAAWVIIPAIRRQQPLQFNPHAILGLAAFIPWLVTYLASYVRPMFLPRYLLPTTPFIAVLGGFAAIAVIRWVLTLSTGVATSLIAAAVIGVVAVTVALLVMVPSTKTQDFRLAAKTITSDANAGDAVVYEPQWLAPAMEWYLKQQPNDPSETALTAGTPDRPDDNLWAESGTEAESLEWILDSKRAWVVSLPGSDWSPVPDSEGKAIRALDKCGALIKKYTLPDYELGELTLSLYKVADKPGCMPAQ